MKKETPYFDSLAIRPGASEWESDSVSENSPYPHIYI
jgi:hypothetical protein